MTGVQLGRNSVFYLNTGSYGSPTWSAVANISDLTLAGEWDSADSSTRESVVKMVVPTMVDLAVNGKLKFITDSNTTTIVQAFFTRAVIDIMALNGPNTTTGNIGVRYPCVVQSRGEDQGLAVAVFEDVKFSPTPSASGPPCWVQVVAGAPVFYNL